MRAVLIKTKTKLKHQAGSSWRTNTLALKELTSLRCACAVRGHVAT